uniref:UDENN FLCN/SMCR8-type domain-containing protein n=1 Tax=Eptatretus burgeri TaxID=7764 RepID=A0A8C4QSN5_EPTBU
MMGALEAIAQVYEAYEDLDLRDTARLQLPVELGVPPWPWGDTPNPWSSEATFEEDFILLMEFCELVGPRPVLTIPEGAGGGFDKNFFALRVMSVDYQQSRAWETPVGHRGPWLHVARDSRQLLRHHGEGASAYVHHFTLHDLDARGFVRPLCMAFVSRDSAKLLPFYEDLVTDFGAVSECLKGGNRATFRRSLKELLGDLEHTKLRRRRRMSGERAAFTAESVERSNELGNLERLIFDTKQLLAQVAAACRQTAGQSGVDGAIGGGRGGNEGSDDSGCSSEEFGGSGAAKYTPKLYQARKTRCSERLMKELLVLCGPRHYARAVEMLVVLQQKFKQDTHLLSFQLSPLWSEAFPADDSSCCLFDEIRSPVDGVECVLPHSFASCPSRGSNTGSSSPEAFHSLESYASCVEDVPIKMMQQVSTQPGIAVGSYAATVSLDPEAGFRASDDLGPEFVDQAASAESGDSIEVLNTEHSSLEVQSWSPESQDHGLWTSKTDGSTSDGASESHEPPRGSDGEKVPSSLRQPDKFKQDTHLLSFQLSPLWSEAFPADDSSCCLFDEIRSPVDGVECVLPHSFASCPSRGSNTGSSSPEAFHSLESYASCVEDVPIKMMQQVSTQPGIAVGSYAATVSLDPEAGFRASDDLGPEFVDQAASAESGDSIEVLNTEHSSLEVQSWSPESQDHGLWTSKTDGSTSDGASESHEPPRGSDGEKVPSSLRQPDVVVTRTDLLDAGNELLVRERQSETIAGGMEQEVECTEDGKGFQDICAPPALHNERSTVCQPAIDFPLSSTIPTDMAWGGGGGGGGGGGKKKKKKHGVL